MILLAQSPVIFWTTRISSHIAGSCTRDDPGGAVACGGTTWHVLAGAQRWCRPVRPECMHSALRPQHNRQQAQCNHWRATEGYFSVAGSISHGETSKEGCPHGGWAGSWSAVCMPTCLAMMLDSDAFQLQRSHSAAVCALGRGYQAGDQRRKSDEPFCLRPGPASCSFLTCCPWRRWRRCPQA